MRRHLRRLCPTLLAVLVALATAALGTASANQFSISNRDIRWVWNPEALPGSERFFVKTSNVAISASCPVTLEGSFHSNVIAKTAGALIGYITRLNYTNTEPPCVYSNASEFVLLANTLPWHLQYVSFTGVLPTVTSVRVGIVGLSMRFTTGGSQCLYRTTEPLQVYGWLELERTGTVTRFTGGLTGGAPKTSGGVLCPTEASQWNSAKMVLLGTLASVSIRLI